MEIRLMDSHKLLESAVKVCVNPSRLKQKKVYFFQGEVFFLLTRPLMGDPLINPTKFIDFLNKNDILSKRIQIIINGDVLT